MRRSILLLVGILAACAGPVAVSEIAWQAILEGGAGGITGSVGTVSVSGRTHASIAIQHAIPGQRYAWRIQKGDCRSEGDLLVPAAVFQTLVAGDDGSAGVDVFLSQMMNAGPYAARVVLLLAGGSESLAACAPFQQVQ